MLDKEFKILLVEDNPGDAELTIRSLKKNNLGKGLVHLENGEEAIEYIFAQGAFAERKIADAPNVILMDINMPKVSGLEVLRKLKSDERTKIIPVIMLTASKDEPDIKECYSLGVNSYLVKPVQYEEFVRVVKELGLYWQLLKQLPSK
ncbi:MAG: response regulator [Cyclobacteriaceae bacterium]|nr:response regulator [Cyclobacteriaceae bacterium]